MKINFGEKEITKTEVELKLISLNESEKNKIKQIAKKTAGNSPS